jgi:Golgi phosphoprotein 3 (GPP34)
MLLAEELALVAVDPGTGRHCLGTRNHLNATLAALLVCELMIDGYATAGPRKATVVPAGERRPASELLAAAADVVTGRGPKVRVVLSHMSRGIEKRLGYGTWEAALVGLAEAGVLAPAEGGLWSRSVVLDPRPRQALVACLQAAAAGDGPLELRTALVLNMTGPACLLELVAPDRGSRRPARRRIDHALDGTGYEEIGKVVRRLLAEAGAGVGAVVAGGAAASGGA